jgi:DNA polymerase III epsilon subunit-like protein
MRWRSLPIVAFDTETTGLEPFGGDRIIEFAAVRVWLDEEGRIRDRQEVAWLLDPEREIPRKVTEITGIGARDVAQAPRFADKAAEIRELLGNAITVAHNYTFDLAFLTREFDLLRAATGDPSMRWPEPLGEIDTVDLSIRCFPDARGHRLADLAERLDVRLERAHRALSDAAACGEAFVELTRRHRVEDDLQGLLDWAAAIGRPPDDGPIGRDAHGRIVFVEGPHKGDPVSWHPIHLAWIDRARDRGVHGWRWRYPEGVRRWAQRWLHARGSGRAHQVQKSLHANDWGLDPCITSPRSSAAQAFDHALVMHA